MNRSLVLRVLTAAALVGIAVIHLDIADGYKDIGKDPLSLADQFYAQAVLAVLLAVALLVRPHLLVWAATLLFALGSIGVLVYSRYRALPVYGFAPGFQESWEVKGAKPAMYAEIAAAALSAIGLAGALRSRPRRPSAASAGG